MRKTIAIAVSAVALLMTVSSPANAEVPHWTTTAPAPPYSDARPDSFIDDSLEDRGWLVAGWSVAGRGPNSPADVGATDFDLRFTSSPEEGYSSLTFPIEDSPALARAVGTVMIDGYVELAGHPLDYLYVTDNTLTFLRPTAETGLAGNRFSHEIALLGANGSQYRVGVDLDFGEVETADEPASSPAPTPSGSPSPTATAKAPATDEPAASASPAAEEAADSEADDAEPRSEGPTVSARFVAILVLVVIALLIVGISRVLYMRSKVSSGFGSTSKVAAAAEQLLDGRGNARYDDDGNPIVERSEETAQKDD